MIKHGVLLDSGDGINSSNFVLLNKVCVDCTYKRWWNSTKNSGAKKDTTRHIMYYRATIVCIFVLQKCTWCSTGIQNCAFNFTRIFGTKCWTSLMFFNILLEFLRDSKNSQYFHNHLKVRGWNNNRAHMFLFFCQNFHHQVTCMYVISTWCNLAL